MIFLQLRLLQLLWRKIRQSSVAMVHCDAAVLHAVARSRDIPTSTSIAKAGLEDWSYPYTRVSHNRTLSVSQSAS